MKINHFLFKSAGFYPWVGSTLVFRGAQGRPSLLSRSGEGAGFVVQSRVKNKRLNNQTHKQPRSGAWGHWECWSWWFWGSTLNGRKGGQASGGQHLGKLTAQTQGLEQHRDLDQLTEGPCGPTISAGPGPLGWQVNSHFWLPSNLTPPPTTLHEGRGGWKQKLLSDVRGLMQTFSA